MENKPSISIGLPFYGTMTGKWSIQMMQLCADIARNYELRDIIGSGVMTADHNRNAIVHEFLKKDTEWLLWVDSDTVVPVGALERLMGQGKTLVSGIYYGKNEPHPPIAYFFHNGGFTPIDTERKWERGEIIPVDSCGMGCMLTHRSVFEDIKKNHQVFMIPGGGIVVKHNNDVLGEIVGSNNEYHRHEHDGKIYRGQLRERLIEPTLKDLKFPFFMVDHLRTEDMFFFDLARNVGHLPYLDTSVECGHLRDDAFTGKMYRELNGR